MVVKELILKVASICNLNCEYCYVFNQGDNSFKNEPNIIDESIQKDIEKRIIEHCKYHQLEDFIVIFHGGEPLLAEKKFYVNFVNSLKEALPCVDLQFALQTNGTLLTQNWIDLFVSLNISLGISLDGTRTASKYRIYRNSKKNAYDEIIRGINLLYNNNLPVTVLSVMNTLETPEVNYIHLKENHISYIDYLFPDKTHDVKENNDKELIDWLIKLFDIWYDDYSLEKPFIRIFDQLVGLTIGIERGNEVVGRKVNQCLCVKPSGSMQAVDNLMICGDGFTKTGFNIANDSFDDAMSSSLMNKYYNAHMDSVLCGKCKKCIIKNICGGGHLAHRYSSVNGFDNPSVYCKVISSLVMHIQNRLNKDLFNNIRSVKNIEMLTEADFQ